MIMATLLLVFVKIAYQIGVNSIKKILILLTVMMSAFYTSQCKSDYFDITHDGSHSIAALSCSHNICVQSTKSNKNYSYGAGIGYNFDWFTLVLLTSKVHAVENSYNAEFKAVYNDNGISYFAGVKREFSMRKTRFEIGVGYPINEKFSLIAKYSYGVAGIGIRRYF